MADVFQTLTGLHSAGSYSNRLPRGHYLGISMLFNGTAAADKDETIVPQIRLEYNTPGYAGDIVNAGGVMLRKLDRFIGGTLKTTDTAASLTYLCVIPFSHLGYPNSLYIGADQRAALYVGQTSGVLTALNCQIMLIPTSSVPMNYLPMIAQHRYNSLGGINAEPVAVNNLIALLIGAASTTEPDLVSVQTRKGQKHVFTPAHGKYLSDWEFDAEAAVGATMLPLLRGDLSDSLDDEATVLFSGGVGYLDYLAISAVMRPELRAVSRAITANKINVAWSQSGVKTTQAGPIPAPNFAVDRTVSNAVSA